MLGKSLLKKSTAGCKAAQGDAVESVAAKVGTHGEKRNKRQTPPYILHRNNYHAVQATHREQG